MTESAMVSSSPIESTLKCYVNFMHRSLSLSKKRTKWAVSILKASSHKKCSAYLLIQKAPAVLDVLSFHRGQAFQAEV